MRLRPLAVAVATATLSSGPAWSGDTPPTDASPPQQSTKIVGSIPDLSGRWLLVADVSPPGQNVHIPLALGLDVGRRDEAPAVSFRWGGLPPAVQASLDAALAKQEAWRPTAGQLEDIRRGWDTIAPTAKPITSMQTIISGVDAEPESVKRDARLAGGVFTLEAAFTFEGSPSEGILLAAKERTDDGYAGEFVDTTLVATPFPIPVNLPGTFRLHRLAAAPQPGLLRRLLDAFAGCGRATSS